MKRYEKNSLLKCDIQDLFDFHLDVKNLKNITPPGMEVTLLNEDFIPKEGEILKLKTVKNFIPIMWEVKINKLQSPNLLEDLAIKSPFKYWKHSHIFIQKENGFCELKDVVEYEAPFGVIGSMLDFFISYELGKMFDYRHKITKHIIEDTKII
ncbi:SRPBCC family protein [Candidatus Sulfurimonas marisnigri]|uniref:SRPBCC family protein n=1 Tax=Candidatus Sulfurimonas marisnigri TaxID=2740405 RepID=A0A7S7LZD9_9BACT|nr:SRPBCC family protein [Candidatus Sulfurimonas marisnigri]QOY54234.1 SRPBCC family protein [Candidatus Sulfurimonas marisnigri]